MKKNKGITLIALIVTIIVLLIIAGIAMIYLTGENGILYKSQLAKEQYSEASAKEGLLIEISNLNIRIRSEQNRSVKVSDLKLLELEDGVEKVEIIGGESNQVGASIIYKGFEFGIDKYLKIVNVDEIKIVADVNSTIEEKSILDALRNTIFNGSGNYIIRVNAKNSEGTQETVEYSTNLIKVDGNLVLDGINSVQGSTLASNVYEFGDNTKDVGNSTTDAQNTIILLVDGDLTINNGVVLTACKSTTGYGGPKGFVIYCTGKITNNGTISMTARGAKAVGQNVYLYENNDSTFEYIPSVGASGGATVRRSTEGLTAGIKGADAINRQTGGGASGAALRGASYSYTVNSGAGGTGTSYSGGSGGGGISARERNWTAGSGSSIGGPGGGALAWGSTGGYSAGGGAGNSGGVGRGTSNEILSTYKGVDGTGGLLVIKATEVENNGQISSNGSSGGQTNSRVPASGGNSGAGSINIFYNNFFTNNGSIIVNGGAIGGAGGAVGGTRIY